MIESVRDLLVQGDHISGIYLKKVFPRSYVNSTLLNAMRYEDLHWQLSGEINAALWGVVRRNGH